MDTTLAGPVHRKLDTLTAITYSLGKERFGSAKKKDPQQPKSPHRLNRREREIQRLRGEIKKLNKLFKTSSSSEEAGIKDLTCTLRDKLRRFRRAEHLRQKRKRKDRQRELFMKNPYGYARNLLGQQKSGVLTSCKEEVEDYLTNTHKDPCRSQGLPSNKYLSQPENPSIELVTKEPTWKEVYEVVHRAKSSSAPGPSGLPYKIYKKCPKLLRRLWRILRKIWAKGSIPPSWRLAEGCFIPKEEKSSTVSQFRTISLLSVECKIFFSVLARRLTSYMTKNNYINTSIQKGGIPGFSGCLEHTSMISQLIWEAKRK